MIVLPLVAAAGAALLGAGEAWAYAAKRREIARLRQRCRTEGVLTLTYDDGPSSELTPQLLDVLARERARATFFSVGARATLVPHVLDRVRAEGHEIGCHSERHLNAWKVAPWTAIRDIDQGYESLTRWVAPDSPFRPPYGKQTRVTRRALRGRGAPVAWWTIDSGDTHPALPAPEAVVESVLRARGGVVLMHDHMHDGDIADGRSEERRAYVLELTARLLESARAHSLAVRPLGEISP